MEAMIFICGFSVYLKRTSIYFQRSNFKSFLIFIHVYVHLHNALYDLKEVLIS